MAANQNAILFTCGREPEYPRNQFALNALRKWFAVSSITSRTKSYPGRLLSLSGRLLIENYNRYDLIWAGFLGQPFVPLIRGLTRRPILLDAFISLYDTLCFDRRRFKPDSLAGRMIFWFESLSCRLSEFILLDTQAHAQYFSQTFGIPPEKLGSVWVGCDEDLFSPQAVQPEPGLVLYYGSFLPLQGIDTIIRAAQLLQSDPRIRFRIIGQGMETPAIQRLVSQLAVKNIEFRPPVPFKQLPQEIARAEVCLGGHFSDIPKASRVIAGKTFQCLSMGKATIVGDNPANSELLTHARDSWFCPMNDPQALAKAIQHLQNSPDLKLQLGQAARQTIVEKAGWRVLSSQIRDLVNHLINRV